MVDARNRRTSGGAAYERHVEDENDAHIGLLAGKVSQLRQLSIDIQGEIRNDLGTIDKLDSTFDSAGSALKGTMTRLGRMVNSKDGCHMLYLALFVFAVFLFIYKMAG
mmetsp:Transcript_24907/g.53759  ORF Transcript_24907/g.53759 Transcript_24907/m.53759 type:complete len:108 (-) Transcript_24907:415-738(-)